MVWHYWKQHNFPWQIRNWVCCHSSWSHRWVPFCECLLFLGGAVCGHLSQQRIWDMLIMPPLLCTFVYLQSCQSRLLKLKQTSLIRFSHEWIPVMSSKLICTVCRFEFLQKYSCWFHTELEPPVHSINKYQITVLSGQSLVLLLHDQ
jgi:hypothetical protein